jgi:hypothetical protein
LIKQSTQQRGKVGTKREDPSLSQRSKTQSGSLRDKGTNHVPKTPLIARSTFEKESDEKLGKAISLEEP